MGDTAHRLLAALSEYLPATPPESLEDPRRSEALKKLMGEVASIIQRDAKGRLIAVERSGALIISHADTQVMALRVANGTLEMTALRTDAPGFNAIPNLNYDER